MIGVCSGWAGDVREIGNGRAAELATCRQSPRKRTIRHTVLAGSNRLSRLAIRPKRCLPLAPTSDLSPEQAAIARHVWDSPDRVILIRGAAGTGKTHTMKATIAGIDRPVVVLAPSAEASRGVLRHEGFAEADTVARFLIDEKFQETAKDGVIWVDEAGLLGIRQVRAVFDAGRPPGGPRRAPGRQAAARLGRARGDAPRARGVRRAARGRAAGHPPPEGPLQGGRRVPVQG